MQGYFFLFVEDNEILSLKVRYAAESNNVFLLLKSVMGENDFRASLNNYNWDAIIVPSSLKCVPFKNLVRIITESKTTSPLIIIYDGIVPQEKINFEIDSAILVSENNLNKIFDVAAPEKQLSKSPGIKQVKDFYFSDLKKKDIEYSELKTEFRKELKIKLDIAKKLEESENRFQTFQEISPDTFLIFKPLFNKDNNIYDFLCSYINPTGEKMFDINSDEIHNKPMREFLPIDFVDQLYRRLEKVINSNNSELFEIHSILGENTFWYRTMAVKLNDGVAITISDITEKKNSEIKLQNLLQAEYASRKLTEKLNYELEIANKEFMMMGDMIPFGIWKTDKSGKLIYISQSLLDMLNISFVEMSKGKFLKKFVGPDEFQVYRNWKAEIANGGHFWSGEYRFYDINKKINYVLSRGLPFKNENNEIIGWMGINIDITESREIQLKLEQSLKEKNTFYERINDIFVAFDKEFHFTYINSNGIKHTFRKPDLIGQVLWKAYPELVGSELEVNFRKALEEQASTYFETFESSTNKWFLVTVYPSDDGVSVYYKDITYRKDTEEKLKNGLLEKEVLLKEIHHRVKNNLQLISSLLNLQANYIKDEKTIQCFRNSQARIKSMAIVHEQLYHNNSFSSINLKEYSKKLIEYIKTSYASSGIDIQIECEDIPLNIEESINVGLLINELVVNALKHAFRIKKRGLVVVSLFLYGEKLIISVKDDGDGLPANFSFDTSNSFGMQLISALTKQINGIITVNNKNGTEFSIEAELNK